MVEKRYKKRYSKKSPAKPGLELKSLRTFLIIVESPSKCAKIESYLGEEYTCIATKGHIRTIDGLSSIDTKNNYATTYSIIEEKREHVEWMRTIISKFSHDHIILATDDDREGEGIAWHICDTFGLCINTTKRILFREVTKPAIQTAVENPLLLNMNLVRAQQARQVLDMLVGFKISPVLWKHLYRNKDNSLSAGRCQTPALRLVYDNEIESRNVNIEKKYKISGTFFAKKVPFQLTKEMDTKEDVLNFLEKSVNHNHQISIEEKKEVVTCPPKPFNTSNLLQTASSVLHIGPKETMSICQQLYQDGHITYMRTESQKYSDVFLKEATAYISDRFNESYIGNISNVENKDTTNPHEAIRVTHIKTVSIECENGRASSLYKLIWRNTVESCMADARFMHTPLILSAPMSYTYKHIVEVPIFLGWKKINEESRTNEADVQNTGSALLLYIQSSPKDNIVYDTISSVITVHGRHSHYTEASLIKKLEDLGIGRPSTFATIVDTIIERGYVKKTDVAGIVINEPEYVLKKEDILLNQVERIFGNEKNKLCIQPIGILVSEFLTNQFASLFSYEYTKNMEMELDKISQGDGEPWYVLCEKCTHEIKERINDIHTLEKQTFALRDTTDFVVVFDKFGPVLRNVLKDGNYKYENIKKEIQLDFETLKRGEYTLEELLEKKTSIVIGQHDKKEVLLKSGPYGRYIEYDEEKISLKTLQLDDETDVEQILAGFIASKTSCSQKDEKIIRKINDNISIRNGKFGAYIYYKTPVMRKPTFHNLHKFKDSYRFCKEEELLQWIKQTYNLE
jgi:DNA topoisomerase-1